MKRVKKILCFLIIAALILALTYTSVFGVYTQNGDTKKHMDQGRRRYKMGY